MNIFKQENDTAFIGIAIALSLQMANSIIKTEEALAASQKNLKALVAQRTTELAAAQVVLCLLAPKDASTTVLDQYSMRGTLRLFHRPKRSTTLSMYGLHSR